MIKLHNNGVFYENGKISNQSNTPKDIARKNTIAAQILSAHNTSGDDKALKIKFDAMVSHDITYVGIIQTARIGGLTQFPIPYALTNCHNSLCAVGGTINEDDHVFGLSAAKKYGGIYVPANQSVIHSYAREELAGCGKMILGSDSHTRYGALGTMGVGEGGPELVKQLLKDTYDINAPEVVLVHITGRAPKGIGPHDVAIALVGATFKNGFVKNKVLEFVGDGLKTLPIDFRNGIDVMTTETTCLSSIWETDEVVKKHYEIHGRPEQYKQLKPRGVAYYDAMIEIDLSKMESMIALPFHPSNAYTIKEFVANAKEILASVEAEAKAKFPKCKLDLLSKIQPDGSVLADQGIIAGCAGGMFDSIVEANAILKGGNVGCDYFSLSVYPTSIPVSLALTRRGVSAELLASGALIKPSFCGPCFGAGDVPANNGLSLRHTTRNFPNREGSKPGEGQVSGVALMDARSIAATAANGGKITPATEIDYDYTPIEYEFDKSVYDKRVYYGFGKAHPETELILGPNITSWPDQYELSDNVLLELAAVIHDPVTTTDELIPSGETSSLRSNPVRLSEFTLSRRVPEYVGRAKAVAAQEKARREGNVSDRLMSVLSLVGNADELAKNTQFGSCVFANKPGDGSAREQAASCQKVLGGFGNICYEFATKRYRSNCINWGILPFTLDPDTKFEYNEGDCVFVGNVREALILGQEQFSAKVIRASGEVEDITLYVKGLTEEEKNILLAGCLMNYYKIKNGN
ncbi:MAG: hydratase [Ruminococcaceae bacterium]|nr:hydratase [Oscillospiraceae bacterium]